MYKNILKNQPTAPICLFVYNRPLHTKKTIEALSNNILASESELIIFSDGPKIEEDQKLIKSIRNYIKNLNGFKKIQLIESKENKGLANSIIEGVTQICNQYGKIIVLEDDLVTSPIFLKYMNDALNLYEFQDKVISIHGYVYPIENRLPETFFLKGADCWGWATWKRGWDLFNSEGKYLLNQIIKKNLSYEFDYNNSYPYTKMLKNQIEGKNNSWAIRWYASAFLENKLTLYPGKSLVQNIGFDNSGVHCNKNNIYFTELEQNQVLNFDNSLKVNAEAHREFVSFFKKSNPPLWRKGLSKLKEIVTS